MKNIASTGSSPAAPTSEKKMKQGTVLSFFSTKGRNENSRKRKLSSSDEGVKVLKVRCSNDVVTIDDSPVKKEKAVDVDEKAVKVNEELNTEAQAEVVPEELENKADNSDEEMQSDNLEADEDVSKDGSSLKAVSDEEDEEVSSTKSECDPNESASGAALRRCLNNSTFNGSLLDMDDKDSITSISDIPITPMKDSPKARKLTPRQLQKQLESQQRREAKEQEKRDRELQRQQEKEDKIRQRQEKEIQRAKEKMERMQRRQEEIDQKMEEKKAKEDERRRQEEKKLEEKKQKEEEKQREKLKKEEEKLLEKKKREEEKLQKEIEKKKAEEDANKKQEKAAAAFVSFFKKTTTEQSKPVEEKQVAHNAFMPFMLKKGMRLAPVTRRSLEDETKSGLVEVIQTQKADKLYLELLKDKVMVPHTCGRTFPLSEKVSYEEDDEVVVMENKSENDDMVGEIVETNNVCEESIKPLRAKLLLFSENRRPAYWGTWSKKSTIVKPRTPFGLEKMFDYEVDSDEEWEEEEPGESLHGSDDDKESDDGEDYEVDNDLFVPHGYLSDEEAGNSDNEMMPAEEQKERLRQLELEFQEELKKKVKKLSPRMVTCFNPTDPSKADDQVHRQVLRLLERFATVVVTNKIPTTFNSEQVESSDALDDEPADLDSSIRTADGSTKKKKNKLKVPKEAIPDFIRLLHGNTKNRNYLVKEFITFWDKKMHPEVDVEAETEHDRCLISIGNASKVLRELASWEACPDEGAFQGRLCWWVSKEVREEHQLLDLPLPNSWSYILKPAARRIKTPKEKQKEAAKSAVVEEVVAASPEEPLPADTPPKSAKESLITKFTKVLSAEERQQQLEADKLKAKEKKEAKMPTTPFSAGSAFFIKPSTSTPSPSSTVTPKPETPSADPKKGRRVSLLFSVPRGQAIPSSRPATAFTPVVPSTSKHDDDDVQPLN